MAFFILGPINREQDHEHATARPASSVARHSNSDATARATDDGPGGAARPRPRGRAGTGLRTRRLTVVASRLLEGGAMKKSVGALLIFAAGVLAGHSLPLGNVAHAQSA